MRNLRLDVEEETDEGENDQYAMMCALGYVGRRITMCVWIIGILFPKAKRGIFARKIRRVGGYFTLLFS